MKYVIDYTRGAPILLPAGQHFVFGQTGEGQHTMPVVALVPAVPVGADSHAPTQWLPAYMDWSDEHGAYALLLAREESDVRSICNDRHAREIEDREG